MYIGKVLVGGSRHTSPFNPSLPAQKRLYALDRLGKPPRFNQHQMPLCLDAHFLERPSTIAGALVHGRLILETTRPNRKLLQHFILWVEVKYLLPSLLRLLRLLARRLVCRGQRRCNLGVAFGQDEVVCEGIGLFFGKRPLDFFEQHGVHWGDDFVGHVDEAFGEDEADLRGRRGGEEGGEGGDGGGGVAREVGCEVLDDFLLLGRVLAVV